MRKQITAIALGSALALTFAAGAFAQGTMGTGPQSGGAYTPKTIPSGDTQPSSGGSGTMSGGTSGGTVSGGTGGMQGSGGTAATPSTPSGSSGSSGGSSQ